MDTVTVYRDWCEAVGADPWPASLRQTDRFRSAVPCSDATWAGRLASLRAASAGHGWPEPGGRPVAPTVSQGMFAQVAGQLHAYRFPVGLRGRRDAWALLLLLRAGLTRNEARTLTVDRLELAPGVVTVAGHRFERTAAAQGCPACVAYRWLEVAADAQYGFRRHVRAALDPFRVDMADHVCTVPAPEGWRRVTNLLPAIDQHGWVSTVLSKRSVTALRRRCEAVGAPVDDSWRATARPDRFRDASLNDLADAYDDVSAQIDELIERTSQVLNDAETMRSEIDGLVG